MSFRFPCILINKLKQFAPVLGLIFLLACECDKKITCPGVSDQAIATMPLQDSPVFFTDGNDSLITFRPYQRRIYRSYEKDCKTGYLGGCECSVCDLPYYYWNHRTDLPLVKRDSFQVNYYEGSYVNDSLIPRDTSFYRYYNAEYSAYGIELREYNNLSRFDIYIHLLDFNKRHRLDYQTNPLEFSSMDLSKEDSLLVDFDTPEASYSNVVRTNIAERDSILHSLYFSKVYYNLSTGIIAFEDWQGNRFYRVD